MDTTVKIILVAVAVGCIYLYFKNKSSMVASLPTSETNITPTSSLPTNGVIVNGITYTYPSSITQAQAQQAVTVMLQTNLTPQQIQTNFNNHITGVQAAV